MTFRDDHEAALARAEALERQLEEAREKADEAAAEALEAHAERARLEDELADLRDVQQERTAERAVPVERTPPAGSCLAAPVDTLPDAVEKSPEPVSAGVLGIVIVLVLSVLLLAIYAGV